MEITQEIVKYVAHLARIDLQPNELEKLALQLKDILDFIDKLKKVEIKDTVPTSHVWPLNNIFRDDTAADSLPTSKVLSSAPVVLENFFSVPKVIE